MSTEPTKQPKYVVLGYEDLEKLPFVDQTALASLIEHTTRLRASEGRNPSPLYFVCNQDEPYAEEVWQVILRGERGKVEAPKRATRRPRTADLTLPLGDCEVALSGDYEPADPSVGLGSSYTLNAVWLTTDPSETDILTLLSDEQIERLEEQARYRLAETFAARRRGA